MMNSDDALILDEWKARNLIHVHCKAVVKLHTPIASHHLPYVTTGCRECFKLLQRNCTHLEYASGHRKLNLALEGVKI
jgi:hypothetical protein